MYLCRKKNPETNRVILIVSILFLFNSFTFPVWHCFYWFSIHNNSSLLVCVHSPMHIHVGTRSWRQVSSSTVLWLIFEAEFLTESRPGSFAKLAGQKAPTIYLFLPPALGFQPCTPEPVFYMDARDSNSSPQACTANTFTHQAIYLDFTFHK